MNIKTKFTPPAETTNWLNMLGNTAMTKRGVSTLATGEGGGGTNPLISTDPNAPKFNTQAEHDNYYLPLATNKLKEIEPELYLKYQEAMSSGDALKAQSYIAARGGLPKFIAQGGKMKDVAYSNYSPDKTNLKDYIQSIREKSIDVKKYNQEVKKKERESINIAKASNQF